MIMRRIAALLALATLSACGPSMAEQVRRQTVRRQMRDYLFHEPLPVVWGQARALLYEHGYGVVDQKLGRESSLRTTWLVFTRHRERYLVSGFESAPGMCQVSFTRVHVPNGYAFAENPPADQQHPDLELEWELVRRLEPDAARRIAADADAAAARH